MNPTTVLAVISILSLVGVEYGGWALLSFLTVREGLSPFGSQFFRAGHAHAGVLLVLSLVYFIYLDKTHFGVGLQWFAGLLFLFGTLTQSGGFFVHMGTGGPESASLGTKMTRGGGVLLGAALIVLAVGLLQSL